MKAILEFSLPEEQDEHRAAVDGAKWKYALHDVHEFIRQRLKHDAPVTADEIVQAIREEVESRGLQWD